ncbi:S8 family serine peptidase [Robiginitalea sp.]|nr:S8 family serine peptidase [Robiginitalea sp.]
MRYPEFGKSKKAQAKGILVIASAGNFNNSTVSFPAAFESVLAVGAINQQLQKASVSAYGMEIAISAPGEQVFGAHSDADNAYFFDSGTSPSSAFVAACAAILYSKPYVSNSASVIQALINSATLFPDSLSKYSGRLGSGILNLDAALQYAMSKDLSKDGFNSRRTRGIIQVTPDNKDQDWHIRLGDGFHGIFLKPSLKNVKNPEKLWISIEERDALRNTYKLTELPRDYLVKVSDFKITFEANSLRKNESFQLEYFAKPIDSTTLYCQNNPVLVNVEGEIGYLEDGSNEFKYTNDCSCKWIIKGPENKKIKLIFEEMNTEANHDLVYVFNGNSTMQESILARFSGDKLPPVITSSLNEVLVWFVSDSQKAGEGWRLRYEMTD